MSTPDTTARVAAITRARLRAVAEHRGRESVARNEQARHHHRVLAARWALAHDRRHQSPAAAAAWDARLHRAGVDPVEMRRIADQQAERHRDQQAARDRAEQRDNDWTVAYIATAAVGTALVADAAAHSVSADPASTVASAHPDADRGRAAVAAATADADHAEEVAAGTRVQADADSHRVVAAAHPEPFTAVPSERADATDAPVDLDVIADTGIAL